eukprot:3816977-Prymnesium_polylepis.2
MASATPLLRSIIGHEPDDDATEAPAATPAAPAKRARRGAAKAEAVAVAEASAAPLGTSRRPWLGAQLGVALLAWRGFAECALPPLLGACEAQAARRPAEVRSVLLRIATGGDNKGATAGGAAGFSAASVGSGGLSPQAATIAMLCASIELPPH